VILNVIVLALAFLSAGRLLGWLTALLGFLLIAFDPFSIALARLLHPDGLLSGFVLLSVLAMINFYFNGRRFLDLILSAIAAACCWLTKSPSLILLPFFALLGILSIYWNWRGTHRLDRASIWTNLWPVLVWIAFAVGTFVLLWPAMWVNPVGTISDIISQAFTYAEEGHNTALFFNGRQYPAGISDGWFYPLNYLWRSTPSVLAGLVLAGAALIFRKRLALPPEKCRAVSILLLFALIFTLLMSIGGKKFDRYLLPIFAPLCLVAAWGWAVLLGKITGSTDIPEGSKYQGIARYAAVILLAVVVLAQIVPAVDTYPYYLSYYNPLMGGSSKAPQVMMIGWGEGLDQAASYLNEKPNAGSLRVNSWYEGPVTYLFNGKTLQKDFESDPRLLDPADYYVLYIHQWQRGLPSQAFLDFFAAIEPEYAVWIDGIEYARVYSRESVLDHQQQ
jgi:hypothetical protein